MCFGLSPRYHLVGLRQVSSAFWGWWGGREGGRRWPIREQHALCARRRGRSRRRRRRAGSLRPAIDFRGLNLITERDSYPLPNIEANLAALGRANWFTTVDLLQGFLQLELSDSAKIKTAFTIGNRQYQFKRMPMGLTSSPSSFMRVVDAALRGLPPGIAYAYV